MIYRIIALIIKELQEQVSSARGVAVLIVPILIQTLIFPFVATQDITNCKVAVYCEDTGSQAVEFLQRLSAAPYISEVQMLYGDEQLRQALDKQLCMVGIHIPPTFSRHIARGAAAPIQVIGDGQRSNSSQIAVGYVSAILNELYRPSTSATTPIVRHLYNPNLSYKWFILTCLFGMLGMITSMNISCMALAKEREAGTFEQLCVTPLATVEMLAGKVVPATLILMVQCCVIFAVATLGYGLPVQGSVPALFCSLLIYSLALAGIGFSISSFCSTQQQAFIGMFCFMLPAVLLSGFLAPVENMPDILQYLTRLNPLYYIFIITRGIFLKGYDFADIIQPLTTLLAMGSVTMLIAYTTLRRSCS